MTERVVDVRELHIAKRNGTFQVLLALKASRSKRNEVGELFVEGITSIKAALRGGKTIKRIVRSNSKRLSDWGRALVAEHEHAQLLTLDEALYNELCDKTDPSELLATFEKESLRLAQARLSARPFVVIVDRPSNHGNLGSIIRSANAFSVDLVIIVGHGVDPYDPAVIRSSVGSVFLSQLCHVESLGELRRWIEKQKAAVPGLSCIGTDSEGSTAIDSGKPLDKPAIVLLGNEAKGLSVELKGLTDRMVRIPMTGAVDSLNVACAASIVMYEVARTVLHPQPADDPRLQQCGQ